MFGKKDFKLLSREEKDEELVKKTSDIILNIEKKLSSFREMIYNNGYSGKEVQEAELHKIFIELKIKINELLNSVKEIMLIETEVQSILYINDKDFLNDKYSQLLFMNERITENIELLETQPSIQELKQSVLEKLKINLDAISQAVSKVKEDTDKLKKRYKEIQEKVVF